MHIATGQPEDHPSLLPLAPEPAPPAQGTRVPTSSGPGDAAPLLGGVFDAAADQAGRLSGYTADIAAAQAAGMSAENDRRAHYHGDILPPGAMYGDQPALPEVPAYATPAAGSFLYPGSGDEPVPAA